MVALPLWELAPPSVKFWIRHCQPLFQCSQCTTQVSIVSFRKRLKHEYIFRGNIFRYFLLTIFSFYTYKNVLLTLFYICLHLVIKPNYSDIFTLSACRFDEQIQSQMVANKKAGTQDQAYLLPLLRKDLIPGIPHPIAPEGTWAQGYPPLPGQND